MEAGEGVGWGEVLGAGGKACRDQYENAKAAVAALGLNIEVEYITDMEKVMEYGVMSMPAIVVNDKVVSMGKLLKAAEVEKLLRKLWDTRADLNPDLRDSKDEMDGQGTDWNG